MTLKIVRQADPHRLAIAEGRRQIWDYVAPAGTEVEDLATPSYWLKAVNVRSHELRAWDRLECREETGKWYCEFVIVHSSHDGLVLQPLKGVLLPHMGPIGAAPRLAEGLRCEYRGPHLLWCVVNGETMVRDKFRTEAEARAYMMDYARTTGNAA